MDWKINKNKKSLDKIIQAHIRISVSLAHKFKYYGLAISDLIQEGNIGLLEAAKRFDTNKGNRFSTYASWWVRAQIQDYILRNWSIVRTGSTAKQKSLFFHLRRLRAQINSQSLEANMGEDDLALIARELGVSTQAVAEMENRMNGGDSSLNAPIHKETTTSRQDTMADTSPTPEEIIVDKQDLNSRSQWINTAIDRLTIREKKILKNRKMPEKATTLDDLGSQLGISKERVRQIEKQTLSKLKKILLNTLPQQEIEQSAYLM